MSPKEYSFHPSAISIPYETADEIARKQIIYCNLSNGGVDIFNNN
jgi:hypothetical protein